MSVAVQITDLEAQIATLSTRGERCSVEPDDRADEPTRTHGNRRTDLDTAVEAVTSLRETAGHADSHESARQAFAQNQDNLSNPTYQARVADLQAAELTRRRAENFRATALEIANRRDALLAERDIRVANPSATGKQDRLKADHGRRPHQADDNLECDHVDPSSYQAER